MSEEARHRAAEAARERYSNLLDLGTRIAFIALLVTFALYVFGIVSASTPLADLPKLWHLSAKGFHEATNSPLGWAWVSRLGQGESLNLGAVSLLVLVALPCYLAVLPLFSKAGDRAYTLLAAAHAIILVIAAFGIR